MITDPIADYLTQIRNAQKAKHPIVEIKSSSIKKSITEILCDQGYIKQYEIDNERDHQGAIKIRLKYSARTGEGTIVKLTRISKPGRRVYRKKNELSHIFNGLGISIISTPQGIMTDKEARKRGIGGEELCQVY